MARVGFCKLHNDHQRSICLYSRRLVYFLRFVLTPCHLLEMAKKAPIQAVTGESGVHLIARIVDEMGHIWHPAVGPDSGIDGQIELRDPATGELRNVRLGVQSKATTGKWDRETEHEFSYRPEPHDIAYWLSSNQPVLLICSRDGEAYWRSVQEWARDPVARAKGYLRFNKQNDRFDASAAARLFDLKAASGDWVEPPGPPRDPEQLLTNLMPIVWRTDHLLSVEVPSGDASAVLGPAWDQGIHHQAGVLKHGRYWSFAAFDERFLKAISASGLAQHPLSEFLDRESIDEVNILKELVVRALVARHEELRWHAYNKVAYFRRREEATNVEYAWTKAKPSTVVHARFSTGEDVHFTGYRHDAAELTIRDLGEQWAVQITPTYLFTWDGKKLSGHHDKALAGIKKLDKHRAVSASVRMWQHLFTEHPTLLEPATHEFFELHPLLEVVVPFSINADDWAEMSDEEASEAQGTIFELEDIDDLSNDHS
jgi:hypothetical protein